MITSNSTKKEIHQLLKAGYDESLRVYLSYVERNWNKILPRIKKKGSYTLSKTLVSKLPDGTKMYQHNYAIYKKFNQQKSLTYKSIQNYASARDSNFIMIENASTLLPECLYILGDLKAKDIEIYRLTTHALRRYRDRFLQSSDYTWFEVAEILTRRNTQILRTASLKVWGQTDYQHFEMRIMDGHLFAHYDHDREVFVVDTFVTEDMLKEEQFSSLTHPDAVEYLKHESEALNGVIPTTIQMLDHINDHNNRVQIMADLGDEQILLDMKFVKKHFNIDEKDLTEQFQAKFEENKEKSKFENKERHRKKLMYVSS